MTRYPCVLAIVTATGTLKKSFVPVPLERPISEPGGLR